MFCPLLNLVLHFFPQDTPAFYLCCIFLCNLFPPQFSFNVSYSHGIFLQKLVNHFLVYLFLVKNADFFKTTCCCEPCNLKLSNLKTKWLILFHPFSLLFCLDLIKKKIGFLYFLACSLIKQVCFWFGQLTFWELFFKSTPCDRVGCFLDGVLLCNVRLLKTECPKEIGSSSFGRVSPK